MFQRKLFLFSFFLILVSGLAGIAWSQCDPDRNDSAVDAATIGFSETVSGYVCPTDSFDYYTFEVASGEDVTGTITFSSPQIGTVVRISGAVAGTMSEWSTTDSASSNSVDFTSGELVADTYYIRVTHWSAYAYDHEYTITMGLSGGTTSDCVDDGNEDASTASEIAFGETVSDYVCDTDHLDIWHFTVSDDDEGKGTVTLTASPGELEFYLYDSSEIEIHMEATSGGTLEYDLDSDGAALASGDYYIGVLLPLIWTEENSYTLELEEYVAPRTIDPGNFTYQRKFDPVGGEEEEEEGGTTTLADLPVKSVKRIAPSPGTPPWPVRRGNSKNNGRAANTGPFYGEGIRFITHNFELDVEDFTGGKYYNGLIVGADGQILILEHPSKKLLCFKIPDDDIKWELQTGSNKPACMGLDNHLYYIHQNKNDLVRAYGITGVTLWTKTIPGTGAKSVELTGKFIYTSVVEKPTGSTSIHMWNKEGNIVGKSGPLAGNIVGVVEDLANNAIYVQTGIALYKLNAEGKAVQTKNFPNYASRLSGTPGLIKPAVFDNGRVWAYDHGTQVAYLFGPDASTLGQVEYPHEPQAMCIASDGRFYVAIDGKIFCYEGLYSEVWEKDDSFYAESGAADHWVGDMVMDSLGIIYDCLYRDWYWPSSPDRDHQVSSIFEYLDPYEYDPDYGRNQVGTAWGPSSELVLHIMAEKPLGGGVELAIGGDRILVILHSTGYLQVRMRE